MNGDHEGSVFMVAMRAPDDVSEVRSADGRVARIERHTSYPGAKRVYLDPAPGGEIIAEQWSLPPTSTPPSFYPEDLPFVGGLRGLVMEGMGRRTATWRDDAPTRLGPEALEQARSAFPPEFADLFSPPRLEDEDPDARASRFREALRGFRERWDGAEAPEWPVDASGHQAPDPRFLESFEACAEQMTSNGWIEQPPAESSAGHAARSATFVRGDRQRHLSLTANFGVNLLTLFEKDSSLEGSN